MCVCMCVYRQLYRYTWTAHQLGVQIQSIWTQSAHARIELDEDLCLSTFLDYPFAKGMRAEFGQNKQG